MDVEAAFARGAQDRLRQDEPIGRDHRDIEVERREFSLRVFALQALRRADGQAMLFGPEDSEEHTSELQSLMRISYAVFCVKINMNNSPVNPIVHTDNLHSTLSRQSACSII